MRHKIYFNAAVLIRFAGFRTLAFGRLGRRGSALARSRFRSLVGADPVDLDAGRINFTASAGTAA